MSTHAPSATRIATVLRDLARARPATSSPPLRRFVPRRLGRALPLAGLALLVATASAGGARSADRPLPVAGRWDVSVASRGFTWPAWFEITESEAGLAMRMVGTAGAPFAVPFVTWDGSTLEFRTAEGEHWRGSLRGRVMTGTLNQEGVTWVAVRAPRLETPQAARWGQPVELFDGRTLAGWRPRHAGTPHGWTVRHGALANVEARADLRTVRTYRNFKLSLSFRLQPGSDSGVHLRGRYEVQLTDRADPASFAGGTGSIYGMVAPEGAVTCAAGQWHTLEVTLLGREVTVVLDGKAVLQGAPIPGITGDALDSREGSPGPIVLQGYLGQVEFRDIVIVPAL